MSRKPISQLNTTYTDTQDGDTLPMDRGGAIGKITFLAFFNGILAKMATGTVNFGTAVAGFLRVTTSSSTSLDLQATAVADTHERLRINKGTTGYGLYTANSGASVTYSDYFVTVGATGATQHDWYLNNTLGLTYSANAMELRGNGPLHILNDVSGTATTHQKAYLQYNDSVFGVGVLDSAGEFVAAGMTLAFGASGATSFRTVRLEPLTDNFWAIGSPGLRWAIVYAVNGTINTSDAREKEDIQLLTDAEARLAIRLRGLVRSYRWKRDPEKKHFGVIAQEVIEAFEAEGLNWQDYGVVTGGGDEPYGVNYAELHSLILGV